MKNTEGKHEDPTTLGAKNIMIILIKEVKIRCSPLCPSTEPTIESLEISKSTCVKNNDCVQSNTDLYVIYLSKFNPNNVKSMTRQW